MTISLEIKNKQEIEKQLKSTSIDWDAVVKVSTAHYVFPALYCNLKRVDFLKYLPQDLVNYMEYITHLNRDRNTQIVKQAQELNSLLLANNIRPIFLKGTGNSFFRISITKGTTTPTVTAFFVFCCNISIYKPVGASLRLLGCQVLIDLRLADRYTNLLTASYNYLHNASGICFNPFNALISDRI